MLSIRFIREHAEELQAAAEQKKAEGLDQRSAAAR